jgi:hypothetical protein
MHSFASGNRDAQPRPRSSNCRPNFKQEGNREPGCGRPELVRTGRQESGASCSGTYPRARVGGRAPWRGSAGGIARGGGRTPDFVYRLRAGGSRRPSDGGAAQWTRAGPSRRGDAFEGLLRPASARRPRWHKILRRICRSRSGTAPAARRPPKNRIWPVPTASRLHPSLQAELVLRDKNGGAEGDRTPDLYNAIEEECHSCGFTWTIQSQKTAILCPSRSVEIHPCFPYFSVRKNGDGNGGGS